MTDARVREIIGEEFKLKSLGTTQQLLEIHEPVYVDGQIEIARIDREYDEETVIAYLSVKGEHFYFAAYIDIPNGKFGGLYTEPYNRVYFRATSEHLSFDELKALTTLIPTEGWNKGDIRKPGLPYKFSDFTFLPNPEPDEFEDKLNKLLSFLEQDKEGVLQLVEKAHAVIQIAMNIHNGNGLIGGRHLSKEVITRMSRLNLSIDFDLYLEGKPYLS